MTLKANAKPLALIETATKSRHIYLPLLSLSDPPTVVEMMAPHLAGSADAARALIARAMLKSSKGDLAGAWKDLLTSRRAARLISQGGCTIEGLVGMALESLASWGCCVMITDPRASATQLRAWGGQLEALKPLTDIRIAVTAERFVFLDAVMILYRKQRLTSLGQRVAEASVWLVDWNEVLRTGNHWYDRSLAPLTLSNLPERRARLAEAEEDTREMFAETSEMSVWDWVKALTPTGRRKKTTQAMAGLLVATLLPSLDGVVEKWDHVLMDSEMLQVAVALALHEAETGRFPPKLTELAPKYLKALPTDRFSGKPLVYKREGKGCVVYSVGLNLTNDGGVDNREDEDVDFDDAKDDIVIRFKR